MEQCGKNDDDNVFLGEQNCLQFVLIKKLKKKKNFSTIQKLLLPEPKKKEGNKTCTVWKIIFANFHNKSISSVTFNDNNIN